MSIRIGPGTMIAGFQHPGGGGGGGGGGFTTPTTAPTDPFGGSGPSYSFNGIDNALTIDVNTQSLDATGQAWCVEGFFYQSDSNPFPRVFSIGTYPSASIAISLEGGTMYYWMNGGIVATPTKPNTITWNHFAFASDGTSTSLYLNGNQVTSVNQTLPNIVGGILYIGAESPAGIPNANFGGFINSFRWTVGNQVYTGNFTVPTSALQTTQASDTNINAITSGQVKLLM